MEPKRRQNPLIAVFWDYPEYTDEGNIRRKLEEKKDGFFRRWAMRRFLANGRVVDTFRFFSIREISDQLDTFRLKEETVRKWKRMIEVYGPAKRA